MKFKHGEFTLSCNSGLKTKLESFKSYLCIIRWNRNNYTTSLDVFNYKYNEGIPIYKLRPEMYWFDFENPVCSLVSDYDLELSHLEEAPCQVHAYPMQLTNIKYFNDYLDDKEMINESIKYTTNHKACVFNDLARPINSGHGYAVK